jgi:hypothetical protein
VRDRVPSSCSSGRAIGSTVRPHLSRQRPWLAVLMFVTLMLAACASGSAIVTGTKRAPITADLVKLYLEPPAYFEVIGLVSASSDAGMSEQSSVDYATAELKKQAAKLGANGVLLISIGDMTSTVAGGIGKTVQGKAIFVGVR